jgi:hypothetical protein
MVRPKATPTPLYPWGRAPCDGCPQAPHCRAHLAACEAFDLYLKGGTEQHWSLVPRAPQHELYVSLMSRRAGRPRKSLLA